MSSIWNAFRGLFSPIPARSVKRRSKTATLTALTLVTVLTSGCSVVHNGYTALTRNGSWNDTVVVLRNRSFSAKAWHRRKARFCKEKYASDFSSGFRAGYEACASGADGCTPAFPPSEYWSWEYQSAEGQGRTSAWFAGYPHGARAAEEDGVANWNQVPMSAGMQAEYQQAGILTHEGALYPIPDPNAPALPTSEQPPVMIPMADGTSIPLDALEIGDNEQVIRNSLSVPNQTPRPISH